MGACDCREEALPPPNVFDGGQLDAQTDAAGGDANAEDANVDARVRADSSVLPPADLEVVLPFGSSAQLPLSLGTLARSLDIHFSVDTTASFAGEIDQLQADLIGTILPALRREIDDVGLGVSRFEDFPVSPFGAALDRPYELLTPITQNLDAVRRGVSQLDMPSGFGGDAPESGFEALYQIATGEGYRANGRRYIDAAESNEGGGVGFREDSVRAVVHVTDVPSHRPRDYESVLPGTRGLAEASDALRSARAYLIGVASSEAAVPDLEALAILTHSVAPLNARGECATGRAPVDGACPLVFSIEEDGSGLSTAIVDAIAELLRTLAFREVYGDAIDDRFRFFQSAEAFGVEVPPGISEPEREDRFLDDGLLDTFTNVEQGAELEFRINLHNSTVRSADYDQIFRIRVGIFGDDRVVTERTIRVIVPAMSAASDAGVMDAGMDAAMDAGMDSATDAGDAETPDAGADAGDEDSGPDDAGEDSDVEDGGASDAASDDGGPADGAADGE